MKCSVSQTEIEVSWTPSLHVLHFNFGLLCPITIKYLKLLMNIKYIISDINLHYLFIKLAEIIRLSELIKYLTVLFNNKICKKWTSVLSPVTLDTNIFCQAMHTKNQKPFFVYFVNINHIKNISKERCWSHLRLFFVLYIFLQCSVS